MIARTFLIVLAGSLLSGDLGQAEAQVADHLKCYKIKGVKLEATVDLDSPEFGLEQGCKISKPSMVCVPVSKTVTDASVELYPVNGEPQTEDRICYKVECPQRAVPDTLRRVDQFGPHKLSRTRDFMLCTPAVKDCGTPVACSDGAGACPPGQECGLVGGNACLCLPVSTTTSTSSTTTTTP